MHVVPRGCLVGAGARWEGRGCFLGRPRGRLAGGSIGDAGRLRGRPRGRLAGGGAAVNGGSTCGGEAVRRSRNEAMLSRSSASSEPLCEKRGLAKGTAIDRTAARGASHRSQPASCGTLTKPQAAHSSPSTAFWCESIPLSLRDRSSRLDRSRYLRVRRSALVKHECHPV